MYTVQHFLLMIFRMTTKFDTSAASPSQQPSLWFPTKQIFMQDLASNPLTLSACADCRCRTSSCRTEQDKDTSGLYWWVGVWFVEFAFAVQQIGRCYLKRHIGEDSPTFFGLTQITSFPYRHGSPKPSIPSLSGICKSLALNWCCFVFH